MTTYSFEVFPPKADLDKFAATAAGLAELGPDFVSVTYGAGGSNQARSFEAIDAVAGTGVPVAGHLTCVGQSRAEIDAVIERYRELGVDHIVALRGDPPEGIDAPYYPHPDGYTSTAELVTAAKRAGARTVSVSCYPEVHPQSPSFEHDLELLAAKVDAGADRAITNMCFDSEAIVRYVEQVDRAGIDVEVVPGIMPINSFTNISRFAAKSGASMPEHVRERFVGLDDDLETTRKLGAEYAAEQIADLGANGIERVHVYTLNRASMAQAVLENLSVAAR